MKKETRIIQSNFEIRDAGEGQPKKIAGIAAVVNTPTILWEDTNGGMVYRMIEVIMPGAFDDVMKDDVRALFNHDRSKILGRTSAGTLRLSLNEKGDLSYEIDPPATSYAEDLAISIQRGDVTQSSFGFNVGDDKKETVETDTEYIVTRTINKFSELFDVLPVTFPAYEDTVAEVRSEMDAVKTQRQAIQLQKKGTPNLDKVNQKLKIRK